MLIYSSNQRGSLGNGILVLKSVRFRIRLTPFFALLRYTHKMDERQSEAERHRNLRAKERKEPDKYRALWDFFSKGNSELLGKFEIEHERTRRSTPSPQVAPEPVENNPPQVVSVPVETRVRYKARFGFRFGSRTRYELRLGASVALKLY